MPEPVTITVLGIIGACFGASEKGVSLLQKIWPTKATAEQGILVELAEELPEGQRAEATAAMKGIYKTLAAANEQVKRHQRNQMIGSVARVVASTTGIIVATISTQEILSYTHKLTFLVNLASSAACLLLSAASGWRLVRVYAPDIEPIIKRIPDEARKQVPALLEAIFYKPKGEDFNLEDMEASFGAGSILEESFGKSYEDLIARVEALEHYCLKLRFVQANQSIKYFFWASLEEALVEAISTLVELGGLKEKGANQTTEDWQKEQKGKILECLRESGMVDIFRGSRYDNLWKEDFVALLREPEGKVELLRRLRFISKVPTFALVDRAQHLP